MIHLPEAINEWSALLSEEQIIKEKDQLNSFNQTTFNDSQGRVICVLLPKNTLEVSKIVQVANQYKIQIHVVSKGKNIGLGSKTPVSGESVLIDLTLMDQIVDFSEEMAYVTVQPGVTFKQVSQFLINRQSNLILDSIGSTGDASIIGNTSERGHGVALLADRFNHVCNMEVVLPTGEIVHTGFEAVEGSQLNALSKWGLGPYIDGLFTQSNLGIITKVTLWLQPKPSHFQIVLFELSDDESLSRVINKMRSVRLNKLPLSLRIFNDIRMLSFSQQYPWESMQGKTPLSITELNKMKEQAGIKGKWVGLGALYSLNEELAKAERYLLKSILSDIAVDIKFYDQESAEHIRSSGNAKEKDFINFIYFESSLQGFTSERALNMCYWRKKMPIPEAKDLYRDECGVLWYCPAVPNRGDDVIKAIKIIESTSKKYNLEPNIGFLFISDRVLDITGAICYDKSDSGQDTSARQCHDEIMSLLNKEGYSPYRLGTQSMGLTNHFDESHKSLLKKLKSLLDPNNILSVDRYIPK